MFKYFTSGHLNCPNIFDLMIKSPTYIQRWKVTCVIKIRPKKRRDTTRMGKETSRTKY